MDEQAVALLRCPVCGGGMALDGHVLACRTGHAFDLAASGYVNLMTGRRARAGDTRDMLLARRRFLARGHYEPLAAAVSALVSEGVAGAAPADGSPHCAVEIGSGTGHHLARAAEAVGAAEVRLSWFGVDASKEAARMAARDLAGRGFGFVVADVWDRVPLADGSALAILSVLSPRNPAEFARLLDPAGVVVVAVPAPDHLAELRGTFDLLAIHPGKEEALLEGLGGFEVARRQPLRFPLHLGPGDVEDLVRMGPSARHIDAEVVARQAGSAPKVVTASFVTLALTRHAG
ncbi:MAG: putative RNA methyltransferase [Actinomycetota bacterium]